MDTPFFSIVIPTIGRPSLGRTLASINPDRDLTEVIVVADSFEMSPGSLNYIQQTAAKHSATFHSLNTGRHNTGSDQLELGYKLATGAWVLNCGDDDVFEPYGLNSIADAIVDEMVNERPARPLMFRTVLHPAPQRGSQRLPVVLWPIEEMIRGEVTGQSFVVPNDKERFGVWTDDFIFMQTTIHNYGGEVAWRTEVISQCY